MKKINVLLEIENTESVLMPNEQVRNDNYRVGEHYKVFVVEVADSVKGVHLIVSRSHPGLVRRLFELEVPEIGDGTVIIKGIAREAGSRTKLAVMSRDEEVDPVGACIGNHGMRINSICSELGGEKIDIVRFSENPEEYISSALSPASVESVEMTAERSAHVVVKPDQLSLAIGREGQNARLAARLTGCKIDIKTE